MTFDSKWLTEKRITPEKHSPEEVDKHFVKQDKIIADTLKETVKKKSRYIRRLGAA